MTMNRRRSHLSPLLLVALVVLALLLVSVISKDHVNLLFHDHVFTWWRDCQVIDGYCYLHDVLRFSPMMG